MILNKIFMDLLDQKQEGDHWDFKLKHHENKVDLMLDIICMANNLSDEDGYIIFGVEDDTYRVIGLKDDENRRNQQGIIDILKGLDFAGHIRPKVELKTLNIDNVEVDILIIRNTRDTPYYLKNNYPRQKTQRYIRANHIYSRINDTNTPISESADIDIVEYLWKKRFGFNKTPVERLKILLHDYDNWSKDFGNRDYCFHELFPEFKVEISNPSRGFEPCAAYYEDTNIDVYYMKVFYHSTILHESKMIAFDEYRLYLPDVKHGRIDGYEKGFYYYYDLESIDGHIAYMLTDGTLSSRARHNENGQFLFFDSEEEREQFEKNAAKNIRYILSLEPSGEAQLAKLRHEERKELMGYDTLFLNQLYQYSYLGN